MYKNILIILNEVLLPLSGIVALITASIAGWKSLAEYRLKLQEEQRIAKSTQVEVDIKLVKHFTELMNIAHARSGYQVSDVVVQKMFDNGFFTEDDKQNLKQLNQKIGDAAILTLPVGVAAQDAAIAAIAILAKRHEILKKPAIQALESMKDFKKDLAEKYISEINNGN